MGLDKILFNLDYMLEIILLVYYLLFIFYHLRNSLDLSESFNLFFNSKNNNYTTSECKGANIKSAENCKGFSETIRQLFNACEAEIYTNRYTSLLTTSLKLMKSTIHRSSTDKFSS